MPKSKRRRAWGSITTISRDKHVIRWVENTPEGRKRKSRTIRGTYREACLELDRLHVAHADDRPCPTVGRAAEMWWLPWVMSDAVKPNTRAMYLSTWENHVKPRWNAVPLDAVHPMDVQRWLDGMTKGTADHSLTVCRKIADFAVKYEAVAVNKFRIEYAMPGAVSRSHGAGSMTLDQMREMWDRLRGERIEAPFILAAFGGCRTGESLAVRVGDVVLREFHGVPIAMVRVDKQMGHAGTEPSAMGDLKNGQSVRTACVPGEYALRLMEIAAERRRDGSEWMADRCDGLPLNQGMLTNDWRRHGAPVEWRALRASWRTVAWHDWHVDYDAAELLMGHKLEGVTGRHYLRPTDDMLADSLARAYADFLGQMG